MANGRSRIFHVEVILRYLMEHAPKLTDKLRGASSPLDVFSPDSHLLDLSELSDDTGHIQFESGVTTTFPVATTTTTAP
jgi:hypothetical protein